MVGCPFGVPNADVVIAACRAGALGVLDLGVDAALASDSLRRVAERWPGHFGVRVGGRVPVSAEGLVDLVGTVGASGRIDTLVVGADLADDLGTWLATERWGATPPRLVVEVTSVDQARAAVEAGADGLVAKGSESGGPVGDATAFVLLQALVDTAGVPVWSQGGIGCATAAAAVVGGAVGVVLDAQVALTTEAAVTGDLRAALTAMDGSETAVLGGYRVYTRPDLPAASLSTDTPSGEVARSFGGLDLRSGLVPVGQDAFLARQLADRFRTVGGVVQAVRRSMHEAPAAARRLRPLAPGSPLASALGTRYPIAQGPMTRVSDRPEFAAAVADGGALPFLALALLRGDEVRTLLRETAGLVGDRPWGAGILGFVPPELREEQMAVLLEQPPPFALIAGGRPSQARPLEDAGTEVFLHVPSPGLLDRFLADGARRFVFEGRECGGHVGPRTSFALWEAQIGRLAASDHVDEVQVLFAGGVHDARSAAMVSAMAAPLAERGARVGVLMGTAYLLTAEAVSSGAIQPGFQEAAVLAERTVLLETSPGHATRCADSAFVQAFAEERARLEAAGATQQEMWAALEMLNLGRLRIASKGLRRDGDALGTVGPEEQRKEGMFMMGQVAGLRAETTTVEALHADVSDGATAVLAEPTAADRADRADHPEASAHGAPGAAPAGLRVAIVGVAGIFPGAADTDAFWANVVSGVDAITEVPAERWDVDTYYDPDSFSVGAGRHTPSKWGGFLPEIPFDALAYGIPPTSLASIEPVQLLSLEVAARALRDAGYADREFDREDVSVIFGAEAGTDLASAYGFRAMYPQTVGPLPEHLEHTLPSLTEDSFPGVLTNVISGRIANRLDLGGVNYTVDAACASSLAAVDLACKELATGTSSMVLCGGADLHNGINDYLLFAGVHALSPTGRCRSFDADADGIALGEGVACIVLKRLDDAERDGDRVYAVIESVAGSSDGKSLGLTAPRPEGQRRALERAYGRPDLSPAEVGMVEAHGTGTVVGDRTELSVLEAVFVEAGAETASIALGSVKSQIGHTKCAAGMAGLIKSALALHRGILPPTLNISTPNPAYEAERSPFTFSAVARPWADGNRMAGISAFGFGGTNFHAVLRAYGGGDQPSHGVEEWPSEIFLFTGADRAAADAQLGRLVDLLAGAASPSTIRLRDLARTVAGWRTTTPGHADAPVQVAIVASDVDDLGSKLALALEGGSDAKAGVFRSAGDDRPTGPVAFVYPGQGSQRPGMLGDLFITFPRLQHLLREGAAWAGLMFPPSVFTDADRRDQREALTDTRVAQPALGIAGLAMTELLAECGVRPEVTAGHSYGELVALAVAGALPEDELLGLSETRGRVMLGAAGEDPGTMAAVAGGADAVREALAGLSNLAGADTSSVVVANDNSPGQVVISGPTPGVEAAVVGLDAAGFACRRIPVACAFHSSVVAGAEPAFAEVLAPVDVRPPDLTVFANATAGPYPSDPAGIRALLSRQLASPVRFREQIEAMYDQGVRVFVEAGSGRVLTQLIGKILGDRPHAAVACDSSGDHGVHRFLLALGELATLGVPVDTARLFDGRAVPLTEAALATKPGWTVNGHLVRTSAGSVVAGGLLPAPETGLPAGSAVTGAVTGTVHGAMAPAGPPPERDLAILGYLQSMRELVEAQRDVFVRYLGEPGAPVERSRSLPAFDVQVTAAPAPASSAAPPVPSAAAPVDVPAPGGPAIDAAEVMAVLLTLVSERTGYPIDMLGPDLDLEADLSIDSIKRLEIVGELAERAGFAGAAGGSLDESVVEELVAQKSLRAIVEWVDERLVAGGSPAAAGAPAVAPDVAAAPAHAPAALDAGELMAVLLTLVSERTGYPIDMLGPDLDLEADLSIDSIKRLEIVGELAERAGFAGAAGATGGSLDESVVEQLVAQKSLRTIIEWIVTNLSDTAPAPSAPGPAPEPSHGPAPVHAATVPTGPAAAVVDDGVDVPDTAVRAVFRVVPSAFLDSPVPSLAGARFAVVDDGGGIARLVVDRLSAHGADARVVGRNEPIEPVDGLVHLGALHPDSGSAADVFEQIRDVATGGVRWLVAATGLGGTLGRVPPGTTPGGDHRVVLPVGAGLAGLWRALARELPEAHVRIVDLDPVGDPTALAGRIVAEVRAPGGPVAVGYRHGERVALLAVEEALPAPPEPEDTITVPGPAALNGNGHRPPALALGRDSVVLLTGGARGITARLAVTLARTFGCSLELVGRSPLPDAPEDRDVADASDATDLRRVLIARGMREPAAIEAECARLLAAREVRATLSALEDAGVKVSYHSVDVRDPQALTAVVEDIYARHGRLDGVVHGAGVIEDRYLADKTVESFRRVFDTKVAGASAIFGALRDDRAFVVLFTSVSGAFGNRGQVDYGAANDALDTLAWSVGPRNGRVLAVDWGPWAGTGMVSAELEREYARRGVGLVDPEDGISRLLAELAAPVSEPEIVLARARVATFEPAAADPVGHGAV